MEKESEPLPPVDKIPFTVQPIDLPERKEILPYNERLSKFLENDCLKTICAHVANGGSLIDLCNGQKLKHSDVFAWLSSAPFNMGHYENALKAREEWVKEAVLKELRAMAFVDPSDIYDEFGAVREMQAIPEVTRRAIKEIEVFEEFVGVGENRRCIGVTKKIRFHDKIKPLELAGKNFGFFVERLKLDASEKLEDILAAANAMHINGAIVEAETVAGDNQNG